ncbi:hypothetical protein ACELLULO517_07765 [Acidisoma cellulosilytica]|uniref:Uncharacterized protein n=1 Tax=Acidisoma cellulosilyticum TaxID=2802395 RepID=A0A964E3N4_9PROT|nr:hypothetical protein [Acidisoma cellulosilyticum]MCB8880128.1 hypothetical protein [Acidisoma cellulosilyticum]
MSGSGLGQPTGTTAFNPSLGESVLYAFSRCGIRRTALTAEHYADARMAANLIQSDWDNEQPNLWSVQEQTIQCVPGQTSYVVNPDTVLILDAFLRMNSGQPTQYDFFMTPVSRTEYISFPDKVTVGQPTVYWFDRLIEPTVTLWQPPSQGEWVFHFYGVNQLPDADLANAATLGLPFYFLKAFTDRLAAELAVSYAPDRAQALMMVADKSFLKAKNRNAENVPLQLAPALGDYYRI